MDISIYKLKTKFQNLLMPICEKLVKLKVSPNQITVTTVLLNIVFAGLIYKFNDYKLIYLTIPVFLFLRMALNALDGMIANKFRKEKIGTYLTAGIEAFENTGRLSELERISDNYLMALNRESKYVVFGPEPLFTYLVAKEREINAIRMIMVGKINSLNSDRIKERLRETYV